MVYSWLVLSLAAMGLSDHSFLVVASVEGLEIHQHIYIQQVLQVWCHHTLRLWLWWGVLDRGH